MTVPLVGAATGFYTRTASGDLACRVCLGLRGGHDAGCAVIALRVQLQELSGTLGLYVVQVRETLDAVERLIHGEETQ